MAAIEFESKNKITVHGYVRENFDNNYWINEVIQIIVQFYRGKGGSLYMCGDGACGKLGIEKYKNKMCKSFTLCSSFQDKALDVSTGCHHTLILDIYGDVWSCGSGDCGQLGNGKKENIFTPQKIKLMQRVIQIAAGGKHSMILLNNGHVLSFGDGSKGQLGHGDKENILVPKVIESLKKYKIIQIAAGYERSVCLAEGGDAFCFGDNTYGQCGVGKEAGEKIIIPTRITFDGSVASVECGDDVTLFIDKNASIFSCGRGDSGPLGHGDEDDRYEFTLIEALDAEHITQCSSGEYHSLCIDDKGIVWSFGDNEEGQCALGYDVEKQLTPKKIEYFDDYNIKAVKCSAEGVHSCIISSDGDLYVFGWNDEHYYYTPQKVTLPQDVPAQKVSAGFQHTAVISKCN